MYSYLFNSALLGKASICIVCIRRVLVFSSPLHHSQINFLGDTCEIDPSHGVLQVGLLPQFGPH